MKQLRNKSLWFVLVASMLILAGCCCTNKSAKDTSAPKPTPCQKYLAKVRAHGVTVIQIGNKVKLVLPKDDYFAPGATALKSSSFAALDAISDLMVCYRKIDVKISVYDTKRGSYKYNMTLTNQQAKTVANYLWQQGIDARLLTREGYGYTHPIGCETTASGQAENRRIEITFWRVTEPLL